MKGKSKQEEREERDLGRGTRQIGESEGDNEEEIHERIA